LSEKTNKKIRSKERAMKQKRKDKYLLRVTKAESLQVHDKPGHTLTLTEMEGEAIEHCHFS
jgi:hypothetical protein